MYNEIFPPIIEKRKTLDANKRLLHQLLELFDKNREGKPKSYRCTAKSHATMFPKKFIQLYHENLRFLIKSRMDSDKIIFSLYFWTRLL